MQISFSRTIELDKVFNSLHLEPIQQTEDGVIPSTLPISGLVDRESATETVNSGSIPGCV